MTERTDTQRTPPRQFADDRPMVEESARANACCGGPAPQGTSACCARDANAKTAGGAGCGCGSAPAQPAKKTACCGSRHAV